MWLTGILVPQAGTEPTLPALEGKVLTGEVRGLAGSFEILILITMAS